MHVVAQTEPRPGSVNEDFLVVDERLVIVLDGCGIADSLAATLDRGCVHGVPWYVESLAKELTVRAADPELTLAAALSGAIAAVTDQHRGGCDLTNPDTPSSTVAMLRERDEALDYLVLADASVIMDGPGGAEVICDRVETGAGRTASPPPLGSPERAAWDAVDAASRAERVNRPGGGLWVAGTDPAAAGHALTGSVPRAGVRRAVVATDGACRLVEFGELTVTQLLDLVQNEGPAALIQRTRAAEEADPDGERYPRGKRYDDATVAFCRF